MYVSKITISKLRCFASASLTLNYPHDGAAKGRLPNVNLLLGMNGTGKTTVLKALAIGVPMSIIRDRIATRGAEAFRVQVSEVFNAFTEKLGGKVVQDRSQIAT